METKGLKAWAECDGVRCNAQLGPFETVDELREKLEIAGWQLDPEELLVFCPSCATNRGRMDALVSVFTAAEGVTTAAQGMGGFTLCNTECSGVLIAMGKLRRAVGEAKEQGW